MSDLLLLILLYGVIPAALLCVMDALTQWADGRARKTGKRTRWQKGAATWKR